MINARELRIGNCAIIGRNGEMITVDANDIVKSYDDGSWLLPIALTPEILKSAGFEDWGEEVVNEWETCHNYVLYNIIEGTSSIKVCFVNGNYGAFGPYSEWVFKIDNDTIYNKGLEYLHQLQNVIFALTHQELQINLQTITQCHTHKITNS